MTLDTFEKKFLLVVFDVVVVVLVVVVVVVVVVIMVIIVVIIQIMPSLWFQKGITLDTFFKSLILVLYHIP